MLITWQKYISQLRRFFFRQKERVDLFSIFISQAGNDVWQITCRQTFQKGREVGHYKQLFLGMSALFLLITVFVCRFIVYFHSFHKKKLN